MGDKATEVDCAMFGILAEVVWNSPQSPFEELVNSTWKIMNKLEWILEFFSFDLQVNASIWKNFVYEWKKLSGPIGIVASSP